MSKIFSQQNAILYQKSACISKKAKQAFKLVEMIGNHAFIFSMAKENLGY